MSKPVEGISVEIPGRAALSLRHLVTDFSGTLAFDGLVLPGVSDMLVRLAGCLEIMVVTADTFGTASAALAGLPVELRLVSRGEEKAMIVERLGAGHVVALGNGRNDLAMCGAAALAIAVTGPEGLCSELAHASDVVMPDAVSALDLLLHPRRLIATLRS